MFIGFDEDGADLYETKESAISRALVLKAWSKDPDIKIMVMKEVPLWFAHLVKGTWFEFLGYEEYSPVG